MSAKPDSSTHPSNFPAAGSPPATEWEAGQKRVLELIATGAPLKITLEALVCAIEAQMPSGLGSVLLLDPEGPRLHVGAAPHLPRSYNQAIDRIAADSDETPCGRSAQSGAAVVAEDVQEAEWNRYRELAESFGIRSCWSYPIRGTSGTVLGTVALYRREPWRPEQEEMRLIQTAAHIAGIAIERQHSEQALRRSEEHYREQVKNASIGIYRSAADGTLLAVNPALAKMLGYGSEQELIGLNLARDIFADPELRARLLRDFPDGLDGMEVEWKRKDGRVITVRLHGRPCRGPRGEVIYYELTAEDVTERRAMEERLRQAAKMEAVGRLAGGVAHDFNNLLMVISGYAQTLLAELPVNGPHQRQATEILKAAERAAALTQQLLAFSRKQMLQPRMLQLNDVIGGMSKMLHLLIGSDVELVTRLAPDLGTVMADPGQMEQVLMNLAVNARDAMPGGGRLLLETANLAVVQEHPELAPGQYVSFSIADTGMGMDEATQKHLFEPFFTTKDLGKGTGLGLATVYGIVKQSQGHILVESAPGRGTRFSVCLPRILPAQHATTIPAPPEAILLVEDEPSLRNLACEFLESKGYRVLAAPGGEEALTLAQKKGFSPALLLTDVVMPGQNGYSVAQMVRRHFPGVKVLYMSGYGTAAGDESARLPGAGFLAKPFRLTELARQVQRLLNQRNLVAPE